MKRASTPRKSRTDTARLRNQDDASIVRDRDAPAWTPAMFARPVARQGLTPVPKKVLLSLRLDADVVEWFRAQGPGYQSRMNALLRAYMEAHKSPISTLSATDVLNFQRRWVIVAAAEAEELRRTSLDVKLAQTAALYASRSLFPSLAPAVGSEHPQEGTPVHVRGGVAEDLRPPLVQALAAMARWLDAAKVESVVIGGIAASLLGRPRFTRDVDVLAMIPEARWAEVLAQSDAFGFVPRHPDPLEFARRTAVLLLRHEPSEMDVDVVIGVLPFQAEAVANGMTLPTAGLELRLPRVEDLMIMKAIAHRPTDLHDLEGLLAAHPDIDLERVRRWVDDYARAASMPELLADLDGCIARRPPPAG